MFHSANDALRFAYRTINTPIIRISGINSMRPSKSSSRAAGEFTPHDRLAQAAIIIGIVERRCDLAGIAFLNAKYGNELSGGRTERDTANTLTAAAMTALPTGNHNRRGCEKLVRTYFRQKIGMTAIRKDLDCSIRKYYEYKGKIYEIMGKIGTRTEESVYQALLAADIIVL